MVHKNPPPTPPGYEYVFCTWRRDPRTGRIIYAATYGLKAFRILVRKK